MSFEISSPLVNKTPCNCGISLFSIFVRFSRSFVTVMSFEIHSCNLHKLFNSETRPLNCNDSSIKSVLSFNFSSVSIIDVNQLLTCRTTFVIFFFDRFYQVCPAEVYVILTSISLIDDVLLEFTRLDIG